MDTYEAVIREQEFRPAERQQESLVAGLEKRALVWMARHMPHWVNSDHLTALGALAMLATGLSYWAARYNRWGLVLAAFFLAVNWFGDSLDGTLARVRNCQRPRYGFYVDHILDTFGTFFLLGGIGLSGYMNPWIAMGLLIAFLMLSIELYLASYCVGAFSLSRFGFSPTELRILLVAGNLVVLIRPRVHVLGSLYRLFDVGGTIGICGMLFMLVVAAARNTRTLYREEPLP